MKNKILESLKTKFQGVEEKTLARIADKLAEKTAQTATDEEIKKVADSVTFQQVMESYADSRVTEASASAVKNYEKKHGLKDGKKVEDDPGKKADDEDGKGSKKDDEDAKKAKDEMPAWAKQLMEENKKLQARIDASDADKLAQARKATFAKAIENLPQSFKGSLERNFSRMNFKDDDDFKSYMDNDLKGDIEAITKEMASKGAVFGTPKGGGQAGTGEVSDALKRRVEAMKKANEEKK